MTEADQKLMEIVDKKLNFELRDRLLVKPLKPIMVTIKQDEPVFEENEDGSIKKDENNIPIYNTTKTVTKKVESAYRKGIILMAPFNLKTEDGTLDGMKKGDVILYPNSASISFDQLKDSVFVNPYNVVAICNEEEESK